MMSGPQLASEVQEALEGTGLTFMTNAQLVAFCTAVVKHIQNNADVKAGLMATGTVTSGSGSGGSVETVGELFAVGIQ